MAPSIACRVDPFTAHVLIGGQRVGLAHGMIASGRAFLAYRRNDDGEHRNDPQKSQFAADCRRAPAWPDPARARLSARHGSWPRASHHPGARAAAGSTGTVRRASSGRAGANARRAGFTWHEPRPSALSTLREPSTRSGGHPRSAAEPPAMGTERNAAPSSASSIPTPARLSGIAAGMRRPPMGLLAP